MVYQNNKTGLLKSPFWVFTAFLLTDDLYVCMYFYIIFGITWIWNNINLEIIHTHKKKTATFEKTLSQIVPSPHTNITHNSHTSYILFILPVWSVYLWKLCKLKKNKKTKNCISHGIWKMSNWLFQENKEGHFLK